MIIHEKNREYELDITDSTCCVIASFPEISQSLPFYIYCAGHMFGKEKLYAKTWYLKGYHMLITTDGSGEFFYRGSRYILKKNDVIFFDCTEFHEYHTAGSHWSYYYIRMDGTSAKTYADHINGSSVFIYHCADLSNIADACEKCIDLCISPNDNALFEISDLLSNILTEIAMNRHKSISSGLSSSVALAKEYIDSNFSIPVSLDDLAKHVHLSKYTLCRQFTSQMGISPHGYITRARIAESKRLLVTTRKPVSEISELVGYKNTNIFIRNFKKSEGCSPCSFRNKNTY